MKLTPRHDYDFSHLENYFNSKINSIELISLGGEQSVYKLILESDTKVVKVWDIFHTTIAQRLEIKNGNLTTLEYVKRIYNQLPNLVIDEESIIIDLGKKYPDQLVTIQNLAYISPVNLLDLDLKDHSTLLRNNPNLDQQLNILKQATKDELAETGLSLDLFGTEPNIIITNSGELRCIDAHILFCHLDHSCNNDELHIMKALPQQTKELTEFIRK